MKTTTILTIIILIALNGCKTEKRSNAQKVNFGIYETVNVIEISTAIIDTLKTMNIKFENEKQQPIIGYVLKTDSVDFSNLSPKSIRLIKSAYTVDKDGKYLVVVAIKGNPVITNFDIHKTENKNKSVEIHFNIGGARKWVGMTSKNRGDMVAFVIDNRLVSMPYINAEIKGGVALINGLKDEAIAKKISESLNANVLE